MIEILWKLRMSGGGSLIANLYSLTGGASSFKTSDNNCCSFRKKVSILNLSLNRREEGQEGFTVMVTVVVKEDLGLP